MVVATGTNQEPTKNELTSYLEDILGGIVLTLSKSNVYCNDCKWIGGRGGRSLKWIANAKLQQSVRYSSGSVMI